MRDLEKDKAMCEAATNNLDIDGRFVFTQTEDGPKDIANFRNELDAEFMVHARTGWPEAIDRAIAAEKENAELRQRLDIALAALRQYERSGKVLGEVAREAINSIQGEETKR